VIAAKTSLNRAALMGGAATLALVLGLPTAALAQSTAAAAVAEDEGTIVVTGSLIKNPNLVSSSPVTVTSAETIQLKGSNVAEEVLRDIPGVVPSIGSAVNNGNGGASYVDLRGIGSFRNIVLLDGNRVTPSNTVGRVDLNNIPLALVERVDALTGAAVTTYGADAISGVVNFVTKQDFTGVDLQLSYGLTERGDGERYRADLTIGGNFDDGKGNAVLSLGYQVADPVYQGARSFAASALNTYSGIADASSGSPTSAPATFTGTRPIDPITGRPSTNPAVANLGQGQIDPNLNFGTRAAYNPFNFNPYNIFQTPFKRFNIFAAAKYDVNDNLQFYTRGMFSKNNVSTIIAPSGIFNQSVTINLNNPFLPATLRNQFCAFNTSTTAGVYTPRFDQATCDAAALATGTSDPRYKTVTTSMRYRTTEVGPRISDYSTQFFDYRAGLRGNITSSIDWDVSAAYGESENRQTLDGYVSITRARNSLLTNNGTSCINGGGECVPGNWFGAPGSLSQATADYVRVQSYSFNKASLGQLKGIVSGDFGLAVPFATDAIGFAVGAEYRDYFASQRSDLLSKTPGELGGAGGAAPDITGRYNVTEVYGEVIAPIVQDKPFFENLTVEAGARYSTYSVGAPGSPSYDTFTWKAGGNWEIGYGAKVRGNFSRAVRAPNISELFSPRNTGLTNLGTDPCAGTLAQNPALAKQSLRDVCVAQGAPANIIGQIAQPAAGQANLTTGGNIDLQPETATTWTVGAVFQPEFVPGLAITVDYYNIEVKDAVSSPTPGSIVGSCFGTSPDYALANVNNPACALLGRSPATGGLDGDPADTLGLIASLSNLGLIKTDGIDLTISYSRDIGFAKLGIVGNANWTFSQTFNPDVNDTGSFARECVGYYSVNCGFTGSLQPAFQSSLRTTLGFDVADVSVVWRHLSGFIQEPRDASESGAFFPGFAKINAYDYFDLSARFNVTERISLTATISNLTDNQPPIVGGSAGSTSFNSGNTFPSTYDALGRRYTMQVGVRF